MRQKEIRMLKDMQAFITFAIEKSEEHDHITLGWTLSTLGHDIWGTINNERGFVPRTKGYMKIVIDLATEKVKELSKGK